MPHPALSGAPLLRPLALLPTVYVFISHRLFHLTNELKDRLVPHDDNTTLARNALQGVLAAASAVGVGWLIQRVVVLQFL